MARKNFWVYSMLYTQWNPAPRRTPPKQGRLFMKALSKSSYTIMPILHQVSSFAKQCETRYDCRVSVDMLCICNTQLTLHWDAPKGLWAGEVRLGTFLGGREGAGWPGRDALDWGGGREGGRRSVKVVEERWKEGGRERDSQQNFLVELVTSYLQKLETYLFSVSLHVEIMGINGQ